MGHEDNFDYSSIVRLERHCKELYELFARNPEHQFSNYVVLEHFAMLDSLMCLVHDQLHEYPIAPLIKGMRTWKQGIITKKLTQELLLSEVLQVLGLISLFYDGPLQFEYLGNADGD
jgi:hypothetical protein